MGVSWVCSCADSLCEHCTGQGTDWEKTGRPEPKSQRYPVRGLERKGNLESSLKEELAVLTGRTEENMGVWKKREPLCAYKGLWV